MRRLVLIILLAYLVVAISGCSSNLSGTLKDKVSYNLPQITSSQVRHISDITSIAFEWNMIRDPRIKGYVIYRGDVENRLLKRIAVINDRYSTHYVDQNLNSNSIYLYQFSAIGNDGFQSQRSEIKAINTLLTLEPISYSHAISNLPKKIKLIWRPHASRLVDKYVIYKNIENKWTKIAEVPNRLSVEFIDNGLKDNTSHTYKVYAVTFNGIRSKASKPMNAKTKALPSRITKINTTKDLPRKIDVVWSTKEEDIAYFNVYRSTSIHKNFEIIKNTNDTHFGDIIKGDGVVFFYKISIIDTDGLESPVQDVTGTLGQTLPRPATPLISHIQLNTKNEIIIKWENQDSRIRTFTVVKRQSSSNIAFLNSGQEQKIENINQSEFKDINIIPGTTYKYYIYGVDEHGISSLSSPSSTVTTPKLKN